MLTIFIVSFSSIFLNHLPSPKTYLMCFSNKTNNIQKLIISNVLNYSFSCLFKVMKMFSRMILSTYLSIYLSIYLSPTFSNVRTVTAITRYLRTCVLGISTNKNLFKKIQNSQYRRDFTVNGFWNLCSFQKFQGS